MCSWRITHGTIVQTFPLALAYDVYFDDNDLPELVMHYKVEPDSPDTRSRPEAH